MTFSRAQPLGFSLNQVFTSTDANTMDLNQSRALDGNAGGSWSPSGDLEFPGVNGPKWMANRYPKLSSRTVQRNHHLDALLQSNMSSFFLTPASDFDYAPVGDANPFALRQAYVNPGGSNIPYTHVPLRNLPDLSVMTAVTLKLKAGQNVAHGGLPATKPIIDLWQFTSAGVRSQIGSSTTHPSGTQAAYDAAAGVDLTIGGLSLSIDAANGNRYLLRLRGEGSTNSNGDVAAVSLTTFHTCTLIAP